MSDFGFGLLVLILVLIIAFLWTAIVYLRARLKSLINEITKLKKYIYELIDSAGGDN